MRVLLFHRGGIGDVVFGLPLIDDLRGAFPDARLTVLTHAQGKQVLQFSPSIDRVLALGAMETRWSVRAAQRILPREPFDIALTTICSPRAAYLVWRTGARIRAGFASGPEQILFTHRAPLKPFDVIFSRRYQRLATALGIESKTETPRLRVPPEQLDNARQRLQRLGWDGKSLLIAVHVGGGWPTKQWPAEHIASFARLANVRHGAKLLLQGGAADRSKAHEIVSRAAGMVLNSVGNPLEEAISEARLCRLAIGIDSGLSHATAAGGTPTVFLFGPNDPASILVSDDRLILTRDLQCRPCNRAGKLGCPESHHRCMRDHSPESVLEATTQWISETGRA